MFLKNREGETPPDCCSHNSKAWAALQANRRERDAKNTRLTRAEQKILHRLKLYYTIYACLSLGGIKQTFISKIAALKMQGATLGWACGNELQVEDKMLSSKARLSNTSVS